MSTAAPSSPEEPGAAVGLPPHFHPRVAALAAGPMLTGLVTPTAAEWNGARLYLVGEPETRQHLAVRVTVGGALVGYWAIGSPS